MNDLWNRIPTGGRLYTLLALVAMFVLAIVYLLFISSSIMAPLRTRTDLSSQLAAAERDLLLAQRTQDEEPEKLEAQVATAQAELEAAADVFLNESQAAELMDRLYQYADESGVEIVDLQTQVDGQQEEKGLYDARTFELRVQGAFPRLTDFVSRIREAAVESVKITNANITQEEAEHLLTLGIILYTSPYVSEPAQQTTPVATPADLAALEAALTLAWASEDWEEVINLTQQILATQPDDEDSLEKLYAAHVNYGYQLLDQGNVGGATTQFSAALQIQPQGEEALAGLQSTVATPVSTLSPEEQLAQSLHEPWAAEDWETVIQIIEQILALDPDYDEMTDKLYAAHINHGYQLVAEDKLEEAKEAFLRALEIDPQGEEALTALQELAEGTIVIPTGTPQSGNITHVVQQGDTLFSIARRYGTTVQAIMSANGLTSFNIRVGQTLRIPVGQ